MAVIEQLAKNLVASLFTACVVVGSWWGEQKGRGRLLRRKHHWYHSLSLNLIPNGNSWDQESIIFFVRISLGVMLFLCCHK